MRPYDLVVFDLDGTLADTKQDLVDATNHTLSAMGLKTHEAATVASFVGGGLRLLLQRALVAAGADPEDQKLLDHAREVFVPWYREHMLDATVPFPGTHEMLGRLHGEKIPMAIATNKPRVFTEGIVEALFPKAFDPIVACGDDAPRKPDPTCVSMARARWPAVAQNRILFVGDSLVDIDTARAAGVAVASCSWGFGERATLAARAPEHLVDTMDELARAALGET